LGLNLFTLKCYQGSKKGWAIRMAISLGTYLINLQTLVNFGEGYFKFNLKDKITDIPLNEKAKVALLEQMVNLASIFLNPLLQIFLSDKPNFSDTLIAVINNDIAPFFKDLPNNNHPLSRNLIQEAYLSKLQEVIDKLDPLKISA
jgi:hypothetical protein